jgi:pimeloyl-ACP methyl ester carboxylesterase
MAAGSLAADPRNSDDNGKRCSAIKRTDFSKLADAPTQIISSRQTEIANDLPAYCEVEGYVAPQVRFAVRLPAAWNGKLLVQGCGGFCGQTMVQNANDALRRGYAVAHTDMGHYSSPLDGKWAYNNRQAEIDFGYRATHVTTIVAKALTNHFYGKRQQRTYFRGCSTGGRQGLMAAQRFPNDFDGIIAGAPVIYYGQGTGLQLMWSVRANLDGIGKPILDAQAVSLLSKAAVKACDANDGLRDGIVGNPGSCSFDPAALRCKPGTSSSCLSSAQVETARKIYEGPRDSAGRALFVGGAEHGSEPNWLGNYIGVNGNPPLYEQFIGDLFRYIAFDEDPGPTWQPADLDFDRDPARLGAMERVIGARNPDLRAFKAAGGKIIQYHGWRDQSVVPMVSVDYYGQVMRAMGGSSATQDFYRLFMMPGMDHCTGGTGPDSFDYLTALEDWVERGRAPDMLVGTKRENGATTMQRPVFLYPAETRYRKGNPDLLVSWKRVDPAPGEN